MKPQDTQRIDAAVAQLATIEDQDLAALLDRPAAAALFDEITSTARRPQVAPPPPRSVRLRLPPRRFALSLAGAVAVAVVALVLLAGSSAVDPKPAAAAAVTFRTNDGYIVASVTDPFAAESRLRAAFERQGLDIRLRLLPSSPSTVGTIVAITGSFDSDSIQPLDGGTCVTGGGACPIGIKIARDFSGQAEISLARPARRGENYVSSASAFAPGEVLHCSGLLGAMVGKALPILRAKGLQVEWRQDSSTPGGVGSGAIPATTNYIRSVDPISPDRVLVETTVEPFEQAAANDIADIPAFKARLNRGC